MYPDAAHNQAAASLCAACIVPISSSPLSNNSVSQGLPPTTERYQLLSTSWKHRKTGRQCRSDLLGYGSRHSSSGVDDSGSNSLSTGTASSGRRKKTAGQKRKAREKERSRKAQEENLGQQMYPSPPSASLTPHTVKSHKSNPAGKYDTQYEDRRSQRNGHPMCSRRGK